MRIRHYSFAPKSFVQNDRLLVLREGLAYRPWLPDNFSPRLRTKPVSFGLRSLFQRRNIHRNRIAGLCSGRPTDAHWSCDKNVWPNRFVHGSRQCRPVFCPNTAKGRVRERMKINTHTHTCCLIVGNIPTVACPRQAGTVSTCPMRPDCVARCGCRRSV